MSLPVERLSGTALGSLNIIQKSIFVITTTAACTATLPSGVEGQRVMLILSVDGGDLVITGTFSLGTTATFADVKDSVELIWISGIGWIVTNNTGAVVFA
jgi:hypothetical protein